MNQRYDQSRSLAEKAATLIPGGHHLSGRPLLTTRAGPSHFERGEGARVWDADGNEYLDFIMAYGPFLLGYARPEVDEAAFAQARRGNLLSLNHPLHLTFLEQLLEHFPGAEMGTFFKTGSEATTAALRIARKATGRRLVARCGYHGWHDWCVPEADYVPAGLDAQVFLYDATRPESLKSLLDEHPGAFAAVILAPEMVHPPNRDTVAALMDAAARHGAVFIMDEVKTGIRSPGWSMQARYGVTADITTLSKALGNGWPVAATIGRREVMKHGAGLHLSATYHGETSAMAAAAVTLDIVQREQVQGRVWALGERLISGLQGVADSHGVPARAYGEPIPSMPFLRFALPDPAAQDRVVEAFYGYMLDRGILLHPRHLWFVSAAHSEADVDRTIELAYEAMGAAKSLL
jgi:glutamate-1-semialdehyde 2,1-aminomutase